MKRGIRQPVATIAIDPQDCALFRSIGIRGQTDRAIFHEVLSAYMKQQRRRRRTKSIDDGLTPEEIEADRTANTPSLQEEMEYDEHPQK